MKELVLRNEKRDRERHEFRQRFRKYLEKNIDDIGNEITWLLKNAAPEHQQRVVVAMKLLDKLAPTLIDGQGQHAANFGSKPVNILIGGVNRGPRRVVVEKENGKDNHPDSEN